MPRKRISGRNTIPCPHGCGKSFPSKSLGRHIESCTHGSLKRALKSTNNEQARPNKQTRYTDDSSSSSLSSGDNINEIAFSDENFILGAGVDQNDEDEEESSLKITNMPALDNPNLLADLPPWEKQLPWEQDDQTNIPDRQHASSVATEMAERGPKESEQQIPIHRAEEEEFKCRVHMTNNNEDSYIFPPPPSPPAAPSHHNNTGVDDEEGSLSSLQQMMAEHPTLGEKVTIPVNHTLYRGVGSCYLSQHDQGLLRLITLCDSYALPRTFVDKLNDLLAEIIIDPSQRGYVPAQSVKRETFSKHIVNHFGRPGMQPIYEYITLPPPGSKSSLLIPKEKPQHDEDTGSEQTNANATSQQQMFQEIPTSRRNRMLLVRWHFAERMKQLHNDRSIFGDLNNLVVNRDDPFLPYSPHKRQLDEVLDGSWYRETIKMYGVDKQKETAGKVIDFLSPAIIYLDKTGQDAYQRYSKEPMVVTSAVIRRRVRYRHWAWLPFAFVPELEGKSSAFKKVANQGGATPGGSTADYHFVLMSILQSFREITNEGILAKIRLGDEIKHVRLRCPVAMILNDGKSGDVLLCRVKGLNKGTQSISRACRTRFEDADNPLHECSYHDREQIIDMLYKSQNLGGNERQEAHEELKEWGLYPCKNAFEESGVGFGANNQGIMGATPPDGMHMIDGGLAPYVSRQTIDPLPPSCKAPLDNMVDDVMVPHRSSIKPNFPRTNFAKGFTNLSLITTDEWVGTLLVELILVSTERGKQILSSGRQSRFCEGHIDDELIERLEQGEPMLVAAKKIFEEAEKLDEEARQQQLCQKPAGSASNSKSKSQSQREEEPEEHLRPCHITDLIEVLEAFLCFHAWHKREDPIKPWSESMANYYEASIRRLLSLLRYYLPRKTGNGWKLQKFHDALHLVKNMKMFGLPQNFNCAQGESGLKYWAKFTGKTAQMRGVDNHTKQTGDRIHEFECYEEAMKAYGHFDRKLPQDKPNIHSSIHQDLDDKPNLCGANVKVYLKQKGVPHKPPQWSGSDNRRKHFVEVHPALLDFFRHDMYQEEAPGMPTAASIIGKPREETDKSGTTQYYWQIYTECNLKPANRPERVTFRCHPNYHGEGAFYDWAGIDYQEEVFPCKVLGFVRNDESGEVIVIHHSCKAQGEEEKSKDSVLIRHWKLEYQEAQLPSQVKGRNKCKKKREDQHEMKADPAYTTWVKQYQSPLDPNPQAKGVKKTYYNKAILRAVPTECISDIFYVFQEKRMKEVEEGYTYYRRQHEGGQTRKERARNELKFHENCIHVIGFEHWAEKFA